VCDEFPDFYLAPDAAQGIGFTYEVRQKYAEAKKEYENVEQTWPDSFASKLQPLNIGRVLLASGDSKAAIAAFREQISTFPGSQAAQEAQSKLDDLRAKSPELFADEAPEAEVGDQQQPITLDLTDINAPADEKIPPIDAPPVEDSSADDSGAPTENPNQ
jgi:tetratricopeptide (TPR) repeat protein